MSTVVLTLVGARMAEERRLARLRAAQVRWAATRDLSSTREP